MQTLTGPATLGARLAQMNAGGFVLTETSHPSGQRLDWHRHERANLVVVLQGAFMEVCAGRTFECNPHSVLLKPPGELHADVFGARLTRCLIIEIEPRRWPALEGMPCALERVEQMRGGTLHRLALRIAGELRSPDAASPLAIEGLVLEMLASALRLKAGKTEATPRWLDEARQYAGANFRKQLGLADVAQAVGVHPFHLARQFRRYCRCTVGEFIRRLRIDFACQQLATTGTPLVEIALAAGFSHQPHFCRVFKRQTGMTPTAYRDLSRVR
jgi:AraC family transcriptional regulator